jgi:hypothetical protein
MPIYIDLSQQDLSLVTLQQSLATGEEMVITGSKQLLARILPMNKLNLSPQSPELDLGKAASVNHQTIANDRPRYDFSDLIGRLQWQGNALAEQQRLRDEW